MRGQPGSPAQVRERPAPRTRQKAPQPERPKSRIRTPELWVLAALALLTRMTWITRPRATVFDEVYFKEFALRYNEGTYFFDIHPPLGKLLLAGWARLMGVDADPTTTDPEVALRILPGLAGSALIVVFYLFVRQLGGSRRVATLGAGLLLLDNAFLVESRMILVDSMLLLFGLAAITTYLAAAKRTGRAHWWMLVASAILAGMAAATKWTGLIAVAVVGATWFVQAVRARAGWRQFAGQAAALTLIPVLVYAGSFAVHFRILDHSGPGDAFMSAQYQATLEGNATYDPAVEMGFVDRVVELNKRMHSADESLNAATHPYSSEWTSWPFMKRPVYYYVGAGEDGKQRHIYLLGNPVLWWGLLIGVAGMILAAIVRPGVFGRVRPALTILGGAYAISYLPFATIERPMFLYHYFFAFLFCLAAVVLVGGVLAGWADPDDESWSFSSKASAGLYWGILGVAALSFLYFLPVSYGLELSPGGLDNRLWFDSWR